MNMLIGKPYPLGSTVTDDGVNFALFSAHATAVELCLFDTKGNETARFELPESTNQVWHGMIENGGNELIYGYRVHGPYAPSSGHRFNPNKLLLDPYAKQWVGDFIPDDSHFGFDVEDKSEDLSFSTSDNAAFMPKCKVLDQRQLVKPTRPIERPLSSNIIYELHVKGFTMLHPQLNETVKGKFAGLATPEIINYIKKLGINCVELMPIQAFVNEPFLDKKKLTNYWGYNSLGFFAPHPAYLAKDDVAEFQQLVECFHQADIEVVLDVVYNHTAEGNHLGQTLSFRGIDNHSYYRLHPNDKRFYINDTGCGNTLNITHPRVLQMVMDSLRYWVEVMGVDGFRFDLASCLGREEYGFDPRSGFFDALMQDPVLSQVKLIAEPWDIGPGGYQLGNYPIGWSEWNDRYRDTIKRFWKGDSGLLAEFARRFHGSGDIFEHSGRTPSSTVNFISSHDGFTLRDLVSYEQRNNLQNGEDNRDGHQENYSRNYGVEGDTTKQAIIDLRERQCRNMLSTLLLSQGVPMLLAGDECGRTQKGNNNAYCQDNEINWFNWQAPEFNQKLFEFSQQLIALRLRFSLLCHKNYIHKSEDIETPGLFWFNRHGELMSNAVWSEAQTRTLSVILVGDLEESQDPLDDSGVKAPATRQALLLMLNADSESKQFVLPSLPNLTEWDCLLATDTDYVHTAVPSLYKCTLINQSLMLFHAHFKGVHYE
ncbi:glycogen debranching protein GlgX [Alteromonadaceae bacterium BrNp21-10]|nr:glycogen debranching protein GlgX [Alteromonadaceae bacterium BrNp21-10]